MTSQNKTTSLVLALMACMAGSPACIDHVPVPADITPCPCPSGSVCCDSGVCAKDETACNAATRALSESAAGVWTGYIENFPALDSDDSLRISISVDSSGVLSGHVTIGQAAPPAPATDPSVPWPPSLQTLDPIQVTDSPVPPPAYIPGFTYDARSIHWEAQRLKFMIPKFEPWQPWCQRQRSFQQDNGTFSCAPSGDNIQIRSQTPGSNDGPILDAQGNCLSVTDPPIPVNCESILLCGPLNACACTAGGSNCNCGGLGVCECDASGCNAGVDWMAVPAGYWIDIALRNGQGDGSLNMSPGVPELYNIRVTQAGH